jgi:hypothetical protein
MAYTGGGLDIGEADLDTAFLCTMSTLLLTNVDIGDRYTRQFCGHKEAC